MDHESKKFGKGPKELTGAVDLISYYKLLPHYEFFCKKSLPLSVSDTHYLHHVVGDTEIRKGEGMQMDQLINNTSFSRDTNTRIQPFDLQDLSEAFRLRETAPVDLPSDKEKKHKKHKDRDKEHKKHKHRHKDRSKDKDKDKKKDKNSQHDSGAEQSKKHHEKKRKHEGNEDVNDIHWQKRSKHKSSMVDEIGGIKIAV
nr:hypothetical protein [Tanacetum cinerariifolium]